ncbi:MAG TPA: hypothetical protein VGK25_03885 [Ignavibacteria bacterium]
MSITKKTIFFISFAAIILAYFETARIDAPNYEVKLIRHSSIINNSIEYPYKYRLLNPYMANAYFSVLKAFLSEKASFLLAYFIQNLIIYGFLIFAVFNFLSLWFDDSGALIGTLLFALLVPLSLTGYDTLGDMTTAGLMALGFCCINKGKILMLYPIVFIGAFNELQIILLIIFYFIGNKSNFTDKKAWLNFIGLIIVFLLAYLIVYLIRGGQAGKDDYVWYFTKDAAFNIAHKDWIILWFLMICPYIYFVFKNLKSKPDFLRRNLLFTLPLFYFGAFFFMARLREIDKALTIFLILIPLALFTLIPSHIKKAENT